MGGSHGIFEMMMIMMMMAIMMMMTTMMMVTKMKEHSRLNTMPSFFLSFSVSVWNVPALNLPPC